MDIKHIKLICICNFFLYEYWSLSKAVSANIKPILLWHLNSSFLYWNRCLLFNWMKLSNCHHWNFNTRKYCTSFLSFRSVPSEASLSALLFLSFFILISITSVVISQCALHSDLVNLFCILCIEKWGTTELGVVNRKKVEPKEPF